jgi:xylan 1,4-beta-xylosidase
MDRTGNTEALPRRRVLAALAGGLGVAAGGLAGVPAGFAAEAATPTRNEALTIHLDRQAGPLDIGRFGVGHGGYWDEPTWLNRALGEVRALRSKHIRLFVQEYYDLLPRAGEYYWSTLDHCVDMISRAGSTPLMCLTFKPRILFPVSDANIVAPNDWAAWEDLVYRLVLHYKERGTKIDYWEIGNEGDIGPGGGCPYKFTPDNYAEYYEHTARAVVRADPNARVGGPALARYNSPILPVLLSHCQAKGLPIHFVSWHNYNSDPATFTRIIEYIKDLLRKYPSLKVETIIDEWNCDIGNPPPDPRFQPCFVAEVVYRMIEAGLDYANYYHIRDLYVDPQVMFFLPWWNPESWNKTSLMLGLFDFQDVPRPSYYLFRLLSRLRGTRVEMEDPSPLVHGLCTYDADMNAYNLLVWNFSESEVNLHLNFSGSPAHLRGSHVLLDAVTPSNEEFARLKRRPPFEMGTGGGTQSIAVEPFGIHFLSLTKADGAA